MSDTIIAALITGVFGLFTGLAISYRNEISRLLVRSRRLPDAHWKGRGTDISVPGLFDYKKSLDYEISGDLKLNGSKIEGVFHVESDEGNTITIEGDVKDNEFLLYHYKNNDGIKKDFGVGLIHVDGTGKKMRGFFLGRRMREDGLALGRIELEMTSTN